MLGITKHIKKYWIPKFLETNALGKLKKDAAGAAPGSRAWPVQSWGQDKELGIRIDWGESFVDPADGKRKRPVNFQANKNAENEALKASAAKDSHKVIHQVLFPLEKADQDALVAEDFAEVIAKGLTTPK